ncbi:hypothetical protein L3V82_10195 [Thiotrichales bacterium 19S3-7]|nr:hypothetical protein [Thiotrichales bacterium 19S3-7]MCF6802526.1 hypothetical protein [Thiotrichales bacterium 19S3-11]
MSRFISFLVIVVVAGIIGILLVEDQGVMVITVSGYMIESPLWFAVFSIIVLVFVCIFIIKVFKGTVHVPFFFSSLIRRRKRKKALKLFKENMLNDLSGDYDLIYQKTKDAKTIKHYQALGYLDLTDVGLLVEANALLQTKNYQALDELIEAMKKKKVNADFIQWLKAKKLLSLEDENSINQAHRILTEAKLEFPKSRLIYRALIDFNLQMGYPVEVLPLLEEADHHRLFTDNENDQYYLKAIIGALKELHHANEVNLSEFWSVVPTKYKKDNKVLLAYIETLIYIGEYDQAKHMLKKLFKKAYSVDYVKLWAKLKPIPVQERLNFLKEQLKETELLSMPEVVLIFARLAIEAEDYEAAKQYLESIPETAEVTGLLAEIYHRLNMYHKSVACFQRAISAYAV